MLEWRLHHLTHRPFLFFFPFLFKSWAKHRPSSPSPLPCHPPPWPPCPFTSNHVDSHHLLSTPCQNNLATMSRRRRFSCFASVLSMPAWPRCRSAKQQATEGEQNVHRKGCQHRLPQHPPHPRLTSIFHGARILSSSTIIRTSRLSRLRPFQPPRCPHVNF